MSGKYTSFSCVCILTHWQPLLTSRVLCVKKGLMQFPVFVTCRTQKVRVELTASAPCKSPKYTQVNTLRQEEYKLSG